MRQRRIGGVSAVPIFDVIEQLGDVAALKLDEAAVAYVRQNIFLEHPLDLAGGAQAAFVDVAFEPCFGHGLDAVGFGWRRLEGCQALLDAADDAAGDVPGFGDLHRVGRAYLHPALPFVRVADDDRKSAGAARPDPDAVPDQLGVGVEIGLRLPRQLADANVGEQGAACPALADGCDLGHLPLWLTSS